MAARLVEAPELDSNIFSSPRRTASLSSEAYVLALASSPSSYAAAASAPSNRIDIYDKASLQGIQTLPGHEVAITSLSTADSFIGSNGPVYVSSGRDGLVNIWDERSGSTSIQMSTYDGGNKPFLCCDVSPGGEMVAAGTDLQGTDALIIYWDPRKPTVPLRTHAEVHSDDITVVRFLKDGSTLPNTLLSASSDGLLSIVNPNENDEDECVLQVGNFGCSIAQAGWVYSAEEPRIWAASDMETFSVWSNELDQLQNLDIRGPSVHTQKRTWVTDYLVTCRSGSQQLNGTSSLSVYTGSNEGDVALLSCSDHSKSDTPWTLHRVWSHGHQEIVRSLLHDEHNGVLLTGGEDGKINLWPHPPFIEDTPMAIDVEEARSSQWRPGLGVRTVSGSSFGRPRAVKRELTDDEADMDDETQEGKRARRM